MKPKALSLQEWNKLKYKFNKLTLAGWNRLDGLKKLSLLKHNVEINDTPIFGNHFSLKYPDDIYLFDLAQPYSLQDPHKIRRMTYQNKEVGGTIEYGKDIKMRFSGDDHQISLNLKTDTHTLFHTHPAQDRDFDPPSVLDIISYLALIVKYVADLIIDLDRGIEHSVDDPLVVQNCMVFTKDEVYVYYISHQLLTSITEKLMNLFLESLGNNDSEFGSAEFLKYEDFVYQVEKLLEELEIVYASYLCRFNYDLDSSELSNYLSTLSSLGIIIQRFKYNDENLKIYIVK